jgi:hypothetical protein
VSQFKGPWAPDLEPVAKQFLRGFRDASGNRIADPTLIAHATRGVDGAMPRRAEWRALQQALDFAVLNSNPYVVRGDGSAVATSDNSEIFVWPIDVASRRLATRYGLLVRVTTGGLVIGPQLKIAAPPDMHLPFNSVRIESPEFIDVLYKVLARHTSPKHLSIATSVHWLAKAWRNSESVNWDDRLVMLKTGFEALTGSSKTPVAAAYLRDLFAGTKMTKREAKHFLWKPAEKPNRIYSWTDRGGGVHNENATPLEHWFRTFGDARNAIIHKGRSANQTYRVKGSAYNGVHFFVAQRVLREAIRVEVANLKSRAWMFTDDERRDAELIERFVKKYGP